MNDSSITEKNDIRSLRSEIKARDQTIQKLQAKIQDLHDALITTQQTKRKIDFQMDKQNQDTSHLQSQNQILQTDCDHLYTKIQKKKNLQGSTGSDLSNAQNEHIHLQERINTLQSEVKSSTETESKLLQKVSDLLNQKHQLEVENSELKQFQSLAEEMRSQLDMAKLQIQQLESIHNQTQESIGIRESELIKLKGENEILKTKLLKVKTANKKFERTISSKTK